MERLAFLKKSFGFIGMALIAPSLLANKEDACTSTNTETAGPFPTLNPAVLVMPNIVGDRTGVPFTINIEIKNINGNCALLEHVIVDVWHCDKDGNYSEYVGTQMQSTDYTSAAFLRGRQTTDNTGTVVFTSIFPGWYQSRATHIHVHVYTADGTTLLISQIAFPEGSGSAVNTVNAASSYGYTKGMSGYTYNASDNVFSDGTSTEMATISGSLSGGYSLFWTAYVMAPLTTTGVKEIGAEQQFQIRQNYPNPCVNTTQIPLVLIESSTVGLTLSDLQGEMLYQQSNVLLNPGEQILDLDVSSLAPGQYLYSVKVVNTAGSFKQSKLLIKQ